MDRGVCGRGRFSLSAGCRTCPNVGDRRYVRSAVCGTYGAGRDPDCPATGKPARGRSRGIACLHSDDPANLTRYYILRCLKERMAQSRAGQFPASQVYSKQEFGTACTGGSRSQSGLNAASISPARKTLLEYETSASSSIPASASFATTLLAVGYVTFRNLLAAGIVM